MTSSSSSSHQLRHGRIAMPCLALKSDRRSVNDYTNEEALKNALTLVQKEKAAAGNSSSSSSSSSEEATPKQALHKQGGDGSSSAAPKKKSHHRHTSSTSCCSLPLDALDWTVPNADADTSERQSVDKEVKRLLALKSYQAMDRNLATIWAVKDSLDRLTSMAQRLLNVPSAYITLMDLGRMYFISYCGKIPSEEMPRKTGFCAHTILSKQGNLVVLDARKDPRFCDNPFVTESPFMKFYAGVNLVSPEGYQLGTFCVVDCEKAWPSFSQHQLQTLQDFAALAMNCLDTHRQLHVQTQQVEQSAQVLASAAHDLLTPLTGVQLSLSLLKHEEEEQEEEKSANTDKEVSAMRTQQPISKDRMHSTTTLNQVNALTNTVYQKENKQCHLQSKKHRRDCLNTASACAAVMEDICETLRAKNSSNSNNYEDTMPSSPSSEFTNPKQEARSVPTAVPTSLFTSVADLTKEEKGVKTIQTDPLPTPQIPERKIPSCYVSKLAARLHTVMEAIPKQVPVLVRVDPAVPEVILADELPIFRAALNLLANSCERAQSGSVRMTVRVLDGTHKELLFECDDSGPTMDVQDQRTTTATLTDQVCCASLPDNREVLLLQCFGKSTLESVSALVRSMGGEFGVSSLHGTDGQKLLSETNIMGASSQRKSAATGSSIAPPTTRFWFKIPLFVPNEEQQCSINQSSSSSVANTEDNLLAKPKKEQTTNGLKRAVPLVSDNSLKSASSQEDRRKTALVIDDSVVVRKTLSRALSRLGYEVTLAEDGLIGLNKLKDIFFDIVLCDFLMPNMDGMDCVREYREWERNNVSGHQQYIIGISAHASSKDVERAIELGMNSYISKPISFGQLKTIAENTEKALKTCGSSNTVGPLVKRRRTSPNLWQAEEINENICLIATDKVHGTLLEGIAKENGFHAFLVESGTDIIRLMKARNWGTVLLDDALSEDSNGVSCIKVFREWEKQNRVHRQKNVYLMSARFRPLSNSPVSLVDLPAGVDGIVGNPASAESLEKIFKEAKAEISFLADDIVTTT